MNIAIIRFQVAKFVRFDGVEVDSQPFADKVAIISKTYPLKV